MITGVNERHKSEGGTKRVTGKNLKVQLVLKEKVKWTRRKNVKGEKRGLRGGIKGTIAKKEKKG